MTNERKRAAFLKAHSMARKLHEPGDAYSVTFGACLKYVLRETKAEPAPVWNGFVEVVQFVACLGCIFILCLVVVGLFATAGIIGEGTAAAVSIGMGIVIIWASCPNSKAKGIDHDRLH